MLDCQNRRPISRVVFVILSSRWPASRASAVRKPGTPRGRAEFGRPRSVEGRVERNVALRQRRGDGLPGRHRERK
jgi:hypothetical protein